VPLLYIFFGLRCSASWSICASVTHVCGAAPQLPVRRAVLAWSVLTVLIRAPSTALEHIISSRFAVTLFLLIAQGVQSFRALHLVAAGVLSMVLFVCSVGVQQGFADLGCVVVDESVPGDSASGKPDAEAA